MHTIIQDIRYAVRTLWRSKLVTFIAVVSLMLAIAGNSVVFGLINGLLLRPLPVHEPHRLSILAEHPRDVKPGGGGAASPLNYFDFRERQTSYVALAGNRTLLLGIEHEGGETESAFVGSVTVEFFDILGIKPAYGRFFRSDDYLTGRNRVVIVSHEVWTDINADHPDSLRSLIMNGLQYEIIGVLPEDFEFLVPDLHYWVPLVIDREKENRRQRNLLVIGRLKPDRTDESAQAELSGIMAELEIEYPEANRGFVLEVQNFRRDIPGASTKKLHLILQAALLFVLLIACTNLANLLMARGQAREREMAIRASLGADRRRILRQLFTESALMGLLSGILGLLLSLAGITIINRVITNIPGPYRPVLDLHVLLFTFGVTLLGVALFGVVPVLQSRRFDQMAALKNTANTVTIGRSRKRLAKLLVVGQISLSLILLGGAGILIRSFLTLQRSDPGFDTENLLTMQLLLPITGYPGIEELIAATNELSRDLSTIPGVSGVIISNLRPRSPYVFQDAFAIDTKPELGQAVQLRVVRIHASPGYFEHLGVPVLRGRTFDDTDRIDTHMVAVVNQAMAQKYWGDASPVGERVTILNHSREIVGVVATVRHGLRINEDFEPAVYLPWNQAPSRAIAIALKTDVLPASLSGAVRDRVLSFDPSLAILQLQPMEQYLEQFYVGQRIFTVILGGFGILALLLAALGTYGVLACTVVQRTHEIGVRMAIGATRRNVLKMFTIEGLVLAAIGIAVGIPGVILTVRIISEQISMFVPVEPVVVVGVGALLSVVVFLASLVPARRAAGTDPLKALNPE